MKMNELTCLECHGALTKNGKVNFICPECNIHYGILSQCGQCGDELQRLIACGAVDFWCNQCNELKSKASAKCQLIKE